MLLKRWEELPEKMRIPAVREYYEILSEKRLSLALKRCFDMIMALTLLIFLSPLLLALILLVGFTSKGTPLFFQTRVTQYGREFRIIKFRTMVANAEKIGAQVTGKNDPRITPVGAFLRKYRLDELPQLINIITGDMTFVGTRPEVPRYVAHYTDEMFATLLLPAGITSETSILYKDEARLMEDVQDPDAVYIHTVMPQKMRYNLESLRSFGFRRELYTLYSTMARVLF